METTKGPKLSFNLIRKLKSKKKSRARWRWRRTERYNRRSFLGKRDDLLTPPASSLFHWSLRRRVFANRKVAREVASSKSQSSKSQSTSDRFRTRTQVSFLSYSSANRPKLEKKYEVNVTTSGSLTRCSYPRSGAYTLGLNSAVFLVLAQIVVSVGSGCFCCRKGPSPSRSKWIISLTCFIVSWFTFAIALLLLLSGAVLNDERTEESASPDIYFCYILRTGVFSTAAVLSIVTIALGIVYYLCLNSSNQNVGDTRTVANQGGGIAMGQPQIP